MPSRREIAEAVAVLTGGRLAQLGAGVYSRTKAETAAFRALSRKGQLRAAAAAAGRGGKFVGRQAITKNPWGIAGLLAYEGYIHRDEIADIASVLGGDIQEAASFYGIEPSLAGTGAPSLATRKVSKANRAVKFGMSELKAGPKGSTGADKGKLPKGAFKTSTKAAGLANPNTPSKIGKGSSVLKRLARKIRSWW